MGADSPGFRHGDYAAGRLYYNGFCYSSSVIDTHAHYLGFAPGGVYSQSNNRRSYGFQLRCLQEEGTRWVACWGCLCLISNRAFRARKSEDRTAEKVRPCAHPPRRYAPGRQGRQLCESRPTQPNFSAQDSPAFLRIQPPRRGERPTPPPFAPLTSDLRWRRPKNYNSKATAPIGRFIGLTGEKNPVLAYRATPLNPAHTKASPPHRKARSAESD